MAQRGQHSRALHQHERTLAGVGTAEYDQKLRRSLQEARLVDTQHFRPDQLDQISAGAYDLYLNIDDGLRYHLPPHLRPCAWWAIDTHLNLESCLQKARAFDCVFAAQRDGTELLQRAGISSAGRLPRSFPCINSRSPALSNAECIFALGLIATFSGSGAGDDLLRHRVDGAHGMSARPPDATREVATGTCSTRQVEGVRSIVLIDGASMIALIITKVFTTPTVRCECPDLWGPGWVTTWVYPSASVAPDSHAKHATGTPGTRSACSPYCRSNTS